MSSKKEMLAGLKKEALQELPTQLNQEQVQKMHCLSLGGMYENLAFRVSAEANGRKLEVIFSRLSFDQGELMQIDYRGEKFELKKSDSDFPKAIYEQMRQKYIEAITPPAQPEPSFLSYLFGSSD